MDNLQFHTITGNHLPLIQELQNLQNIGKLVTPLDLANLEENAWLALIGKQIEGQEIGFPAEMPGKDNTEKAQNYAKRLVQAVRETFPTAAITKELEQNASLDTAALLEFLTNNPIFAIDRTPIRAYLTEHGDAAFSGINDREGLVNQLEAFQRLYPVAPRYEQVRTLISKGIDSAWDIVSESPDSFVEKFEESLGESTAWEIYRRAAEINSTINEDILNLSIRQFLKVVGINSQRKIEKAVTKAHQEGRLNKTQNLTARMTLEVKGLELTVTFDGEIKLH